MPAYRVVRVLIHPGKEQAQVAVVARSVSGSSQVDRVLWRGVAPSPDVDTVRALLVSTAEQILRAADRL